MNVHHRFQRESGSSIQTISIPPLCRGDERSKEKIRMVAEQLERKVSTPTPALPLQGRGDVAAGVTGMN